MKLKSLLLLFVVVCGCTLLTGCLGTAALTPRGWSGPVAYNDSIYVGSMDGYVVNFKLVNPGTDDEVAKEPSRKIPDEDAEATYFYSSLVIANDYLYICGYDGKIYAVKEVHDPEDNSISLVPKWEYPSSGNEYAGSFIGDSIICDGVLYVGSSDQYLYALNVSDNSALSDEDRLLWSYKTDGKIWSTPVVYNGTVYIGSFDHNMYALDALTGEPKWAEPFETGGAIISTPIINNGNLYFGALDQKFYAVDIATGALKEGFTPFKADNWFWGKAVVYNGNIVAASLDGKVYSFDAESGSKLWEAEAGGSIRGNPALVNDLLIVGTDEGSSTGKAYCFNAGDGELIWEYPGEGGPIPGAVHASISSSGSVVYLHATNQKIYAIDAETGEIRWSASTGGGE